MAHKFGKQFHLYIEAVARQRASLSGQNFDGLPRLEPVLDAAGKPVAGDEGLYAFQLITFKEIFGSHSRTISAYWNQVAILPENRVLINSQDARRLGIKDGDRVKLVSASLTDGTVDLGDGQTAEVAGSAQLTEGIRPGVIAVSWHYGHWAYGSHDVEVDGQLIKGDSRRGTGLVPNPAMRLDPALKNVCLTDPIGGSASFFDTRVRLVKV
jgi:anaerobic selenocysteine-containing dehydrogenase